MARSFGRLLASFWNDKDVRPLSVTAKLMYGFLISQDDLEHSGIIPFRPQRWTRSLNIPLEETLAAIKELNGSRFTVTDEDEGELLVRALIRRDDIWKQPNVFKAAAASAKAARSPQIKATLYHEIHRLDLARTNRETQAIRDELLTLLEPFGNPSPDPPEGFPRTNGSLGEHLADGSAGPREGQAKASAGGQGKGEGYGPVLGVPFPHSPTPSPVEPADPARPLWPAAVPDVQAGEEGDSFQDIPPDIGALVAEVRVIRPDWSTRSIRRALDDPSVRERPWPRVRRAMLAVAADPASKHPGRLSHDGPWWHQGGDEQEGPSRPPWCGECDEERRMLDWDGDHPKPCPTCKTDPNARAS